MDDAEPFRIECVSEPARSWSGIRQLLAACVDRKGEDTVLSILERHPGPARLVLDYWRPDSPEQADRASTAIGARVESHLTHNWAVQSPAISGWGRLLADLIGGPDSCLVVPYVNALDWESLAVLKSLFRQPRPRWPRLVLGYDDGRTEPELDEDGIAWRSLPGYVREAVLSFAGRSGARCEEVSADASAAPVPSTVPLPPLVTGREEAARALLQKQDEPDEAACRRVVEAMEACFGRYAFTTTLWLGRELFRRVPALEGELAARAHGIVALSAHNRQFRSQGNTALGRFIAHQLRAALESESRPRVRCALLYRLAVAHGRRLGEIEEAERWARRAVAEAQAVENGGPRYQTAWAHNILAYVHVRSKDAEGARRSMQAAADCACDPVWRAAGDGSRRPSLAGDLALTRSLAVHNLAAAEAMSGEPERAAKTLEKACRLEDEIDSSAKYWAQNLVRNLRIRHRPDLALPYGRAGLRAAEHDREASLRLFFLLQLADLSYRVGDAPAAVDYYLSARELAARLQPIANGYPDLDFPTIAALEEVPELDQAETLLRSKLETDPSPELAAEACSRLAVLAARRGDADAAETWASRASDSAADNGHRHCLVRTAVHLGRAARFLGRHEDAVELLSWASDLSDARRDPESVTAADELRLLVELDRCGVLPSEKVERCLQLVPEALAAASSWSVLKDVLELWNRHDETIELEAGTAPASSLPVLVTAAEAREDCQPLVPAARERLDRLGLETSREPVQSLH